MIKKILIKLGLTKPDTYQIQTSKNDLPMWLIRIEDVRWNLTKNEYELFKEVDSFFVLRQDIEALYESMGYLDQKFFEECGMPELGRPDFEKKYGE